MPGANLLNWSNRLISFPSNRTHFVVTITGAAFICSNTNPNDSSGNNEPRIRKRNYLSCIAEQWDIIILQLRFETGIQSNVPATPCSKMEVMREKWQELVEATSHDSDSICITWACKISTYLSSSATAPCRLEVAVKSRERENHVQQLVIM